MISLSTSNKRLRKLAEHLMNVPEQNFAYGSWSEVPSEEMPNVNLVEDWDEGKYAMCILSKVYADPTSKLAKHCGTTACALGWACTIPEFNKKGLILNNEGEPTIKNRPPEHPAHTVFEIGAEFFGITLDESVFLFSPSNYRPKVVNSRCSPNDDATAQEVAEHILRFIKEREEVNVIEKNK